MLFVQPSINPPGGGNGVACWMLQALVGSCDVTLLTRVPPEFDRANRTFGTTLSADHMKVRIAADPLAAVAGAAGSVARLGLLRDHLLLRTARRLAPAYDFAVTANNESDLGARGVQYVHFPKFVTARPDPGLRWYQGATAVAAYQRACDALTGFRHERMRRHLTLANSEWTAGLLAARHHLSPVVLPPPAAGPFRQVAWTARQNAVVCLGRIAPEKRLVEMMDVVAHVRRRHPDLTLWIAGQPDDRAYLLHVQDAARGHGAWVQLALDRPRSALLELLSACRWGLHGMYEEHFGMAVAELVAAGVVPIAHRSGGPVEILGDDPHLLYDTDADASERLCALITDPALAERLRGQLSARADGFSAERFVERFLDALHHAGMDGSQAP